MPTFDSDRAMSVLGVPGRRLTHRTTKPDQAPGLWCNQKWISEERPINGYGRGARLSVEVRFDDQCNNGHNSFAITGNVREPARGTVACGCLHDDIARAFPELAPLIKWHLFDSTGPMHYVANVLWHAGDRDCWGLRKGEKKQIRNGKTGAPVWELVAINRDGVRLSDTDTGRKYQGAETVPLFILEKTCEGEQPPHATPELRWEPWWKIGEGKDRNLAAARATAVWPEATDEQLCADPEVLKAALLARLPGLVAEFRAAIEGAGFLWSPADYVAAA